MNISSTRAGAEMVAEPESVWNVGAELGEGPVWVERDQALWFVDIKRRRIHQFNPTSGNKRSWDSPEQVGFILPARNGGFVAGLQSGLYRFDESDGSFECLTLVEPELAGNRLNDGAVDGKGRLWFGTMDNGESAKSGGFYCFERGELREVGLSEIAITNGPAVSPDGCTLYTVDTLCGTISASPIGDDGRLGPPRPFVRIAPDEGYPDGPTVDCEGCVWISLYAGSEARRYSPAGELVRRVKFPVANITKIAFGGANLKTAFATTARQMLTAEQIEAQPHAGDLFSFQVDVPGVPCPLIEIGPAASLPVCYYRFQSRRSPRQRSRRR